MLAVIVAWTATTAPTAELSPAAEMYWRLLGVPLRTVSVMLLAVGLAPVA